MSSQKADLPFVQLLLEEEQCLENRLSLDALIALSQLRVARRLEIQELGTAIQKDVNAARTSLEKLAEAGLVLLLQRSEPGLPHKLGGLSQDPIYQMNKSDVSGACKYERACSSFRARENFDARL